MPSHHQPPDEYDFVVVGAGTAGCIVAARLAEAGHAVLLLEAGRPYRRILDIPLVGLWTWLRHPDQYAWNQYTAPQPALGRRQVWFPGGRIVGGSSAINAMLYTRGHPGAYARWGVPGWTWDDLLPFHRRAEDFELGEGPFHGRGGPLGVSRPRHRLELADAFVDACVEYGIPRNDDLNGASSVGAGYLHVMQRGGMRSHPGKSYLALARRHRGFHHETSSIVQRVLFDGQVTRGVVVRRDGREHVVRARREVILSAGTVRSPLLLMRSGVGAADAIRRAGIDPVVDSPGVGTFLQDQLRVPVVYRHVHGSPVRPDRLLVAGARYLLGRRGLLASNVCEAGAVVNVSSGDVPDIRIVFRWRVMPETGLPLVDLEVGLVSLHSRGTVAMNPVDPNGAPVIDPRYLTDERDLATLARGIELARRIASAPAMRAAGLRDEYAPGAESVDAHIRRHAGSAFHPVGTCRMGVDARSVVDPELRVRGVDGLRVVDASVIPSCVSGSAQASVIAVAERAATLM